MSRVSLLPPNYQDLEVWQDLFNSIDTVWLDNIDNPQRVFQLLLDTYNLTFSGYTEDEVSSWENDAVSSSETKVFGIKDFFNYTSKDSKSVIYTLNTTTNTLDLVQVANALLVSRDTLPKTGWPQTLFVVSEMLPDGTWKPLPASTYGVSKTNADVITFSPARVSGTTLKIEERASSAELVKKLRNLGFLFNDTEFVNSVSRYPNSAALHILSSNFATYLATTKGTKSFMDFFSYCFSSQLRVHQLWAEQPETSASTQIFSNKPALFFEEKTFIYDVLTPTNIFTLDDPYTVNKKGVILSDIEVSVEYDDGTANYIAPLYYYSVDGTSLTLQLNSLYKDIKTNNNSLPVGAKLNVKYKKPEILYGNLLRPDLDTIGTPVWLGGDFFPTSHVELEIDYSTFSNAVTTDDLRKFFNYVKNVNLVLREITFTIELDVGNLREGSFNTGNSCMIKVTKL